MQAFARGKGPVGGKSALHIGHHGATHLKMQAVRGRNRVQAQPMVGADVHAAGKTDHTIDDQDFAVVAQVDVREQPRDGRPQKCSARDTQDPQPSEHPGRPVARTDRIHQHTHLHATRMGARQSFYKGIARSVVVEDIGLQRDGVLRCINGGQHGWVGVVAIGQRLHTVAPQQGFAHDLEPHARHTGQGGMHRIARHSKGCSRIAIALPGLAQAQCHTGAPNAVNAQQPVGERAAKRR